MDRQPDELKMSRATEGSEPEGEGHRFKYRNTVGDDPAMEGEPDAEGHRFRRPAQDAETDTDAEVEGHGYRIRATEGDEG